MSPAGALEGLRVLSLGGVGPVPFCAMMLADHGADVAAINRPGSTSVADRALHPGAPVIVSRGSRRIELDLKVDADRDLALGLAHRADVVIEGFRPGVAERLGLGPADCSAGNPGLIYGRMTGYGQDGSLAQRAGHDINYLARTGVLHAIGRRGGPPQIPLNLVGDYGGGGLLLAFGICAALWERARSGVGQIVDAAMVDGIGALMAPTLEKLAHGHWRDERGVNALDSGSPNYDVYETADGQWMAVGAREPVFHRRFLDAIGLPDDAVDVPADETEQRRATIARQFRQRTQQEWVAIFDAADACVDAVQSIGAAGRDPGLRERETYRVRDGGLEPAPAPRLSRTPAHADPSVSALTRAGAAVLWTETGRSSGPGSR